MALAVALAFSFPGWRRGWLRWFLAVLHVRDFGGEDLELGDEVPRVEVAEEGFVGLAVVVAAFDKDTGEGAGGNFGRGFGPDLFRAGRERDAVWLDVAEDEYFVAGVVVAEEEGCTVAYADSFVREAVAAVGSFVSRSSTGRLKVEVVAWVVCITATVVMPPHTCSMANAPTFYSQTITDFNVALTFTVAKGNVTAFCEAHIGHKANTAILVGQIRPYYVIENVVLDGIYC